MDTVLWFASPIANYQRRQSIHTGMLPTQLKIYQQCGCMHGYQFVELTHNHQRYKMESIWVISGGRWILLCVEKYTISWHESARFHRYLVMLHPLPASDVVTVSKSQRLTVDNIVFTWRPRFENTVILCELHASDMFGTNSGVGRTHDSIISEKCICCVSQSKWNGVCQVILRYCSF